MAANIGTSLAFAQTIVNPPYEGSWDFTQMSAGTTLDDIALSNTSGKTVTSSVEVSADGTENVLKWKNSNFKDSGTTSYMTLDFPDIKGDFRC